MVYQKLQLQSPIFLAPMAGVTNVAFRILCKQMGAGLCYTEFLSADALVRYKDLVDKNVFDVAQEERPVVTQIFGEDLKKIFAAGVFLQGKTDIIDLNIGCPAPKIMACGGGSALLKDPKKIEAILESLRTLKTPISCKIRLGVDQKHLVAVDVAKIAEKVGCCGIAVHGRTQAQGYSGKADWKAIKEVKDAVSIPVIGNGDVQTPFDVERMMKETGCDYVMVGRAAMKDPFFFKKAKHYMETGEMLNDLPIAEKMALLQEYIHLLKVYKIFSPKLVKGAVMQFSKGYKNSSQLRSSIGTLKTDEAFQAAIAAFIEMEGFI